MSSPHVPTTWDQVLLCTCIFSFLNQTSIYAHCPISFFIRYISFGKYSTYGLGDWNHLKFRSSAYGHTPLSFSLFSQFDFHFFFFFFTSAMAFSRFSFRYYKQEVWYIRPWWLEPLTIQALHNRRPHFHFHFSFFSQFNFHFFFYFRYHYKQELWYIRPWWLEPLTIQVLHNRQLNFHFHFSFFLNLNFNFSSILDIVTSRNCDTYDLGDWNHLQFRSSTIRSHTPTFTFTPHPLLSWKKWCKIKLLQSLVTFPIVIYLYTHLDNTMVLIFRQWAFSLFWIWRTLSSLSSL